MGYGQIGFVPRVETEIYIYKLWLNEARNP